MDSKTRELYKAILSLKNTDEAAKFFRDLLTPAEIEEFSNRFQMAKLLYQGKSYLKVSQMLKTSTTTVTRVAHWLFRGMGGYKLVLTRLFPKRKSVTMKELGNQEYIKELKSARNEIIRGKGLTARKVFEKLKI